MSASGNESTLALYAIEEKFYYPSLWRSASGNELTLALYAIEEKFYYLSSLVE
ncbi:MAG: hypothetical protein F6K40_07910 [Okeania sp. SIO3I5]|uniref:hypothetical protein n=1 Tax=Okeania sp. SIO3I5 TaxID=2607805 RepID=UPI0013BDDF7A|nr:hypothetical protein [Okeania sp. SIO3I5]NEQ36216.1 hypothetical protein [Okeania sp. SIO3I5]